MIMRTSLLGWLAITVLVLGISLQPTAAQQQQQQPQPGAAKDIVATATDAGTFKTLLKAVEAAGLAQTLKGSGPFTVFAPTDEAFTKLPAGALDALMQDKQKLTSVVTYHVLNGRVLAADVAKMKSAKTVNGQEVTISQRDGAVMVEGAKVIRTDVIASNGVIHVIDAVIQPK
jgi:uncharacterized surface protein with fasciclin (FAS1) repeats